MNKEFLINKVAKILGVSSSEKDFAFQIFLDKTAAVLEVNEALKYSGLGFFYLKENDIIQDEGFNESLSFIPLEKDSHLMDENFFLTFEVKKEKKNSTEFDPSVFSLSIDKATLPFEKDSARSTDISYQLLKKTIEERVEELIAGAVHLEDFKIADTIFNNELDNEEYAIENDDKLFEIKGDSSYEEMIFSRMNFEETDDIVKVDEEVKELIEDSINADNGEKIEISIPEEEEPKAEEPPVKEELPEQKPIEKPKFEFFESKEEKNDAGWTWSEELIEDTGAEKEKKADDIDLVKEDLIEDVPVNENPIEEIIVPAVENKADMPVEDDPFAELEKSFDDDSEIIDILEEEVSVKENIEVQENIQDVTINTKEEQVDENKENTPVEEENPYEAEDSNTKRNLLIAGLVVIGLVAVWIIFFHGLGIIKKSSTPQVNPSNQVLDQAAGSKDSMQTGDTPLTEKTPGLSNVKEASKTDDKTQKLKEARAGDLLREIKNESRVGGNIYTDGSKYYVQVSSWKNVAKAEQEARKLKARGLDGFVVKAYVEQFKGTWYRVRVGSFKTKEEAEAFEKKNK